MTVMLVTVILLTLCRWQFLSLCPTLTKPSLTFESCQQHISSPISVTNIDVIPQEKEQWIKIFLRLPQAVWFWWQFYDGENFKVLMAKYLCRWLFQCQGYLTIISNRPSLTCHQHKMSPTSNIDVVFLILNEESLKFKPWILTSAKN